MNYYPEKYVIKACLLKTGFAIDNLHVGTLSHRIYVRALRNLCGFSSKTIAKKLECKKIDINSELLIRINDDYGEEATIRAQLIMVEAKAHELSWGNNASLR